MDVPQDDGFKWFGEGFEGFPKRLPEDCVEYAIHVIDEKLKGEAALRARLKEIQTAASVLVKKLLKDYIWQREAFVLDLVSTEQSRKTGLDTGPQYSYILQGRINFGDSIADEWLVVFLLRELSRQFSDAWIRIYDTDGEFLLIEAANALPRWLNPEVAENRVWINQGQLKIIPLDADATKTPLPEAINLKQALSTISTSPSTLLHSPPMEAEAFHRIRDHPSAIPATFHNALLSIPRRLAHILHTSPSTISPIIEAFYLRDPISLQPLNTKDTATLTFPPEDFVTTSIKFPRVGYAQLRSQLFAPPPAWTSVRPRVAADPRVEMGMKVACGAEMLVRDPQNADKRAVREMKLLLEEVEDGAETLPTDGEVEAWEGGQRQDEEAWLDINFEEFERELSGRGGGGGAKAGDVERVVQSVENGFGDPAAQQNLRKMVQRFEAFLEDDKAGLDGVEDMDNDEDDDDDDDASSSSSHDSWEPDSDDEGEDKAGSFNDDEFKQAMREMMGMPPEEQEKSGLVDEARKLALEMEDQEEGKRDEEEEVKKIIEMMERELKGRGALNLGKEKAPQHQQQQQRPGKGKQNVPSEESEVEELSSDDEDEGNDVNVDLLRNMLESFKGQAGMAGPASSMMEAMGIRLPRDEGEAKQ